MKQYPIVFPCEMVRAILDNRKTQTRRLVKDKSLGISNPQIVPKKKGDVRWFYHWNLEKELWERHEISIQHTCFCFEGEIERYVDPCDIAKGTRLFPYQSHPHLCPYGQVGDRFWVREKFCSLYDSVDKKDVYLYHADDDNDIKQICGMGKEYLKWKRSIHMPRKASRITLEITGVRVERLQDISEEDCLNEGIKDQNNIYFSGKNHYIEQVGNFPAPVDVFKDLWESINGKGSWDLNPWVWVIEFKKAERC